MNDLISPKYHMELVDSVANALQQHFKMNAAILKYIEKWHHWEGSEYSGYNENFSIVISNGQIDVLDTLHNVPANDLLKIAIDLGVDTPNFIPSIPTFRNALKTDYTTAYDTFTKAYKLLETDPSTAIGLANSALESILKEILKNPQISSNVGSKSTTYDLASAVFKYFKLKDDSSPEEIKTIGRSMVAVCQAIEKIRSEKTSFHGKTADEFLVNDPLYAHFVVNAVSTIGTFLIHYYKRKFPAVADKQETT